LDKAVDEKAAEEKSTLREVRGRLEVDGDELHNNKNQNKNALNECKSFANFATAENMKDQKKNMEFCLLDWED
jgi:hypothetical protein